MAFKTAVERVRSWVRTNITGGKENSYRGPEPESEEERLRSAMERTEFMPPEPFTDSEHLNPKFVKFWVGKLPDLLKSAIVAGFAWLFFRMTGRSMFPEAEEHRKELAEIIAPGVVWLLCFLALTFRRRSPKGK